MRLKNSFRELLENGNEVLTAQDLQDYLTSKELKIRNKTANIAGLQLADLVAHSVRRWAFSEFWNINESKKTFSDDILNILLKHQKFFSHEERILDYGVKKLP